MVNLDLMAGNGSEKELIPDNFTNGTLNSTYGFVGSYYSQAYGQITRCNNFLANIGLVTMDAGQKAVMIGEVKTIRAYNYFNLALYFGDVPLVQKLLTVEEANSVTRTPKAEVWAFCESELKAAAAALPVSVSNDRLGHMTSASALAILGRLQLAQKKWADAATTYKTIIDYNYYTIDPRYRELFLNAGETSREIIMSMQYIRDTYNHALLQYLTPETWGGWHQYSPFNELVEAYECKDGKTIAESPLFDKNNPYNNRDPRMDFNIMISERTSFRGRVYSAKPGTTLPDRLNQYPGVWSGYAIYKFLEDDPLVATTNNTGNNFPLIRYAEVLLGYLEAKLESGSPDLVNRLSAEASKAARHVLFMCIRALDYCPPVDITFGDYLRAIITADLDIVADDVSNYRLMFIEAFRKRGIYPKGIKTLSVESLRHVLIPKMSKETKKLLGIISNFLRDYREELMYVSDRQKIFSLTKLFMGQGPQNLHHRINMKFLRSTEFESLSGLVLCSKWREMGIKTSFAYGGDGGPAFQVTGLRLVTRVGPNGNQVNQILFSLIQRCGVVVKDGKITGYYIPDTVPIPDGGFEIRGGGTLIFDLDTTELRYSITKPLLCPEMNSSQGIIDPERILSQYQYQHGGILDGMHLELNEPFAFLHQ